MKKTETIDCPDAEEEPKPEQTSSEGIEFGSEGFDMLPKTNSEPLSGYYDNNQSN